MAKNTNKYRSTITDSFDIEEKVPFKKLLKFSCGKMVEDDYFTQLEMHFIHSRQLEIALLTSILISASSAVFAMSFGIYYYSFDIQRDYIVIWTASISLASLYMLCIGLIYRRLHSKHLVKVSSFIKAMLPAAFITGPLWGFLPAIHIYILNEGYFLHIFFFSIAFVSTLWGLPFIIMPITLLSLEFISYYFSVFYLHLYDELPVYFLMSIAVFISSSFLLYRAVLLINKITRREMASEHQNQLTGLILKEFEQATNGWLWRTDADGVISYASGNLKSVLEEKNIFINQDHFSKLFADNSIHEKKVLYSLAVRRDFADIKVFVKVSNKKIWLQLVGKALYDRQDNFLGFRGIGSDITESYHLKQIENKAKRADIISEMSSGFSHDFNNLLTAISFRLQLIKDTEALTEKNEEYIEEALQTCEQCSKLTSQMLAYSRKQLLEPSNVDVLSVIAQIFEQVSMTYPDIKVFVDSPEEVYIWTDIISFKNALLNIVNNAVRAMNEKGSIYISAWLVKDPSVEQLRLNSHEYWAISVEDEGPGFSDDDLERACEPFYTRYRNSGGSGLGLSMALGYAQQSEGDIKLQNSQQHSGAQVILYLPFSGNAPVDEVAIIDYQITNLNFLVVEDYKELNHILVEQLQSEQHGVKGVQSLSSALQILRRDDSINFIISDVILRDGIGYELVDYLEQEKRQIPILFITGFADQNINHLSYKQVKLLRKPFNFETLMKMVHKMSREK